MALHLSPVLFRAVYDAPDDDACKLVLASPHFRSLKSVVISGTEGFAFRASTVLEKAGRHLAVIHVRRPFDAIG